MGLSIPCTITAIVRANELQHITAEACISSALQVVTDRRVQFVSTGRHFPLRIHRRLPLHLYRIWEVAKMMPENDDVDACREIMVLLPGTKLLMLTASTREDAAAGELAVAVREVAQGGLIMSDRLIKRMFALLRGSRNLSAGKDLPRPTTM